ncbi:MAG: hypothetical protein ACI8S6_000403 [Myxococcota bacterium]|jgi:hypothetical protein
MGQAYSTVPASLYTPDVMHDHSTPRDLTPLYAALASLALAVLLTWPVALQPTARLIGHPGNDSWNHVWGYWWVGAELAAGRWPIHLDLLAYPRGGTLYFIDTVQAVASMPIQLLAGPAAAYNAVIIFELAFSGFAAWLLARKATGDATAAGAALILYGASPHLLGQAYNGISETVCAGWFPLTLFCLLRLMDRPTAGRSVALGLSAAVCMLTSWYFGLFAALGCAILAGWRIARRSWALQWSRTLLALGGASVLAAALIYPPFSAFRASLGAADALVIRDPAFVEASLLNHNVTDLFAFFRISTVPSPDLKTLYGEDLIIVIYLGWVGLLLAGYALWATRRHREFGAWLWLGGLFFIFSLGPYLNIGGENVELFGQKIPLPFKPLYELLPIFDRISHPFRFVMGVQLSGAVLAAYGARHAFRRWQPRQRRAALAALAAVVLVEIQLASPAVVPVPSSSAAIPTAHVDMGSDPVPGAVLDLPMTVPNLERAVYVWYQSAHGRPVPWGLNDPMPEALLGNRLTMTLIRMEATRARTLPPQLPELDLVVSARALARGGYRYVVVHQRLYPDFKAAQVEALLTALLGEPRRYDDDGMLVYTLEPA